LLVKQRTMLANALRGLATEFGLAVPQGIAKPGELMVYVAALAAIRWNPVFRGAFDRLRGRGTPAKAAIVAVMRKLLTVLNAMLRDKARSAWPGRQSLMTPPLLQGSACPKKLRSGRTSSAGQDQSIIPTVIAGGGRESQGRGV
jgi:hypothetical protein